MSSGKNLFGREGGIPETTDIVVSGQVFSQAEFKKNLKDPRWRIRNLYYIRDKDGKKVKFTPWPAQETFLDEMWYRNMVPKARQRGFSTVIQILALDTCLFEPNTAAAIIAQTETVATQIFADKIVFAYDNLPSLVKAMVPKIKSTESEIRFKNNSVMIVSISTRGLTPQFLHISEFGQISAKFPARATEIQLGALASVDKGGVIVIESTVESPNDLFSTMCKKAQQTQQSGRELSQLDYKLHFASWWDAEEYQLDPRLVVIPKEMKTYFDRMELEIDREIEAPRRAWYVAKLENDYAGETEKMWSQYPTTLEEAFQVSSEGVWLSKQMVKVRRENRITKVPYLPGYPVFTCWDIGVGDETIIWYGQQVGAWVHWINYYEESGLPYAGYVKELNSHPYTYGKHYMPHDADHRRPGAERIRTVKDMMQGLGVRNIEIVPRIPNLVQGIDMLRDEMATYIFDEEHCQKGIAHCDQYSKTWSSTQGTWQDEYAKNGHQHAVDAIRQHAQKAHELRQRAGGGGSHTPNRRNKGGRAA